MIDINQIVHSHKNLLQDTTLKRQLLLRTHVVMPR
jgi:hypothetical protein